MKVLLVKPAPFTTA
jgi:D-alanyl-D-alanine carboxypeptidase (penicillin-binding protein 5/6)